MRWDNNRSLFETPFLGDAQDIPHQDYQDRRRDIVRNAEGDIRIIFDRCIRRGIESGAIRDRMNGDHIYGLQEAIKNYLDVEFYNLLGINLPIQLEIRIHNDFLSYDSEVNIRLMIGQGRWEAEYDVCLAMTLAGSMLNDHARYTRVDDLSLVFNPQREQPPEIEQYTEMDEDGNYRVRVRRRYENRVQGTFLEPFTGAPHPSYPEKEETPKNIVPDELFSMDD